MARPDGGMFGIKLIHPNHLKYPYFTEDFDGSGGRWPLMNFAGDDRGRAIAAGLPIGHRSLVYVIRHQRFVWAIEYTGTLEDGDRAAAAHGVTPNDITTRWSIYRPIRFLAKVALAKAPSSDDIYDKTGVRFKANSFTMKYISADEYRKVYDAITWDSTTTPGDEGGQGTSGRRPVLEPASGAVSSPSALQIDAVLKHLPTLKKDDLPVAQWHSPPPPPSGGTLGMPWEEHSPEVSRLISDLYDNGFVVNFDWPAWQPSAEAYTHDSRRLGTATLDTLQKLLTTHVRKDRSCEGHFSDMVRSGHIRAILERLAEIRSGR